MSKWIVQTTLAAGQPVWFAAKYTETPNGVRGDYSPLFATEAEAQAFAEARNREEHAGGLKAGDTIRCHNKEDLKEIAQTLRSEKYDFITYESELRIEIMGKEENNADETP